MLTMVINDPLVVSAAVVERNEGAGSAAVGGVCSRRPGVVFGGRMGRLIVVGVLAVVIVLGVLVSPGHARFGIEPGTLSTGLSGSAATQAGAAADLGLGFRMNLVDPGRPNDVAGTIRDLRVDLPEGMIAKIAGFAACPLPLVNQPSSPCAREAAVGVAVVRVANPGTSSAPEFSPPTRIYRVPTQGDEAAAFAFTAANVAIVRMAASVDPGRGYRIRVAALTLNETAPLVEAQITLWGTPTDHQGPGPYGLGANTFGGPMPASTPRHRFLSVPTRCEGEPLRFDLHLTPWATPLYQPFSTSATIPFPTGCDQLRFDPNVEVTPEHRRAGQPAGYDVTIDVPQNDDPVNGLETPTLRDAVVRLPAGLAFSPALAHGLQACSDDEFGLRENTAPTCPSASKIGEVEIVSPLVEEPVSGNVFVGAPRSSDPESGEQFRVFVAVRAPGVRLKLLGRVRADRHTGQLTATFADNPPLPFARLRLSFKGGSSAAFVNPSTCGVHTATAQMTPSGGAIATSSGSFTIDEGCVPQPFAPTLSGGTLDSQAGASSPLVVSATRADGQPGLAGMTFDLPPGVVGVIGGMALCGDADAQAGTCSDGSRVGSARTQVGAGASPYSLDGAVYLAGPYRGAPFSLVVVLPVQAGPFALGTTVVRAALRIDEHDAHVTAITDPLPTIVGGIPVAVRSLDLALDRPGFMRNATTCRPQRLSARFEAAGGAVASASEPYQAQRCDRLGLRPATTLEWIGKTQMRKGTHPGLRATLRPRSGDANLRSAAVTLPLTVALDPYNAQSVCDPADAQAGRCPAESRIGWARAVTPALDQPVSGPVHLVAGTRVTGNGAVVPTMPRVMIQLAGQGVTLRVWADTEVDARQRLVTRFRDLPDVPISELRMTIDGGRSGILAATENVCGAPKTTTVRYLGQHAGRTVRRVRMSAPDCRTAIVAATGTRKRVTVRVGGIGPGRLTLRGRQVGTSWRRIVRSDAATIVAGVRLSRGQRAVLRAGRSVAIPVRLTFQPKRGKAKTMRRTVRVNGVRSGRS